MFAFRYHLFVSDGKLKENSLLKNDEKSRNGEEGREIAETESEELTANRQLSNSSDGSITVHFENPESDPVEPDGVKSVPDTSLKAEKSSSEGAVTKTECEGEVTLPVPPMKVAAGDLGGSADTVDNVALAENNLTEASSKTREIVAAQPQEFSELEDAKSGLHESNTEGSQPMETTEPGPCDKLSEKVTEGRPKALKDKTDTDRKRQHENDTPGSNDDDSQPPKRSRLEEVIGKLGERVTIPSDTPENESFECDSTPGDTDSVEKQSEEISGSASEEEEDKVSSPDSKTKMKITKEVNTQLLLCADSKNKMKITKQVNTLLFLCTNIL